MNICDSDICGSRNPDILILSLYSQIREKCLYYEHTQRLSTVRTSFVAAFQLAIPEVKFTCFLRIISRLWQPNCYSNSAKDLRCWSGKVFLTTQWTFTEIASVNTGYSPNILRRLVSFSHAGNLVESTFTNFCLVSLRASNVQFWEFTTVVCRPPVTA